MGRTLEGVRLRRVWTSMLYRCHNAGAANFPYYGGRGIYVCEAWRASFKVFLADMGPRSEGLSIDRIDNDRGYDCGHCADCHARGAPANCRWTDQKTQMRNTRRSVRITVDGERLSLAEAAKRLGVSRQAICNRRRAGWTAERVAMTRGAVAASHVRQARRCKVCRVTGHNRTTCTRKAA
jgi:hypothetical protein